MATTLLSSTQDPSSAGQPFSALRILVVRADGIVLRSTAPARSKSRSGSPASRQSSPMAESRLSVSAAARTDGSSERARSRSPRAASPPAPATSGLATLAPSAGLVDATAASQAPPRSRSGSPAPSRGAAGAGAHSPSRPSRHHAMPNGQPLPAGFVPVALLEHRNLSPADIVKCVKRLNVGDAVVGREGGEYDIRLEGPGRPNWHMSQTHRVVFGQHAKGAQALLTLFSVDLAPLEGTDLRRSTYRIASDACSLLRRGRSMLSDAVARERAAKSRAAEAEAQVAALTEKLEAEKARTERYDATIERLEADAAAAQEAERATYGAFAGHLAERESAIRAEFNDTIRRLERELKRAQRDPPAGSRSENASDRRHHAPDPRGPGSRRNQVPARANAADVPASAAFLRADDDIAVAGSRGKRERSGDRRSGGARDGESDPQKKRKRSRTAAALLDSDTDDGAECNGVQAVINLDDDADAGDDDDDDDDGDDDDAVLRRLESMGSADLVRRRRGGGGGGHDDDVREVKVRGEGGRRASREVAPRRNTGSRAGCGNNNPAGSQISVDESDTDVLDALKDL